ncbi:peptidase [Allopusillimonas ginsengisoli]|nr:peptidase [Allopusillimonas ginsengisoli]
MVLALCSGGLAWGADAPLAQQQASARKQQAELRDRIAALQKEIDNQESARRDAANELKASESAISDINRRLAELDARRKQLEAELAGLNVKISAQKGRLAERQGELGDQLRAQYAGGLSPWTALLSGDDPQVIGRNLSYLGYITQSQAQAIRAVRQALDELAVLQNQAQAGKQALEKVADQTTSEKQALEKQKAERQRVLARIEQALKTQRSQAAALSRNDERLGELITGLEAEIKRQEEIRKAEEARRRAEAARKAEEARKAALERRQALERERERAREAELAAQRAQEQAERQQKAQEAARAREQVERARQQAREAEQAQQAEAARQAEAQRREEATRIRGSVEGIRPPGTAPAGEAAPSAQPAVPAGGFQGLGKHLTYPVKGQIQGKFGAQRPEGGLWRGIVLRASEGTPVRVVAAGRVVYANWLAGFGNIMIVDHGDQYLTVYAYNQSLLKQVGDIVKAGDTVAAVGATGGQVEPGLYFEIRHKGTPVNPLLWLSR